MEQEPPQLPKATVEARLFVTREDHIGDYGNICNRGRRSQRITFALREPARYAKGRPSSDRGLWGGLELHVLVDRKLRGRTRGVVYGTGCDYAKATGTGTDLDGIGIRRTLPGNTDVVR